MYPCISQSINQSINRGTRCCIYVWNFCKLQRKVYSFHWIRCFPPGCGGILAGSGGQSEFSEFANRRVDRFRLGSWPSTVGPAQWLLPLWTQFQQQSRDSPATAAPSVSTTTHTAVKSLVSLLETFFSFVRKEKSKFHVSFSNSTKKNLRKNFFCHVFLSKNFLFCYVFWVFCDRFIFEMDGKRDFD